MFNVKASTKGRTVTLTIDVPTGGRPSSSGKTELLASTEGNATLTLGDGEIVKLGLNLYRAAKAGK